MLIALENISVELKILLYGKIRVLISLKRVYGKIRLDSYTCTCVYGNV